MNAIKLVALLLLLFARPAWALEAEPDEVGDDTRAVVRGCNAFATDLYARLRGDKPANLFFSPYSVSVALSMTYAGAAGETEAQMAKVLHLGMPRAKVPPAFGVLHKLLDSHDDQYGFRLAVANRLWAQKDFHLLPDFLAVNRANYGAELGLVDFGQTETARAKINSWIEKQTEGKIQDLLTPDVLDSNTRLVLTNAIYFKSHWKEEFSKKETTDAPFHISAAEQTTVPMMHQEYPFRYHLSDNVQVLELPYAYDTRLRMLVLLPSKVDGLADLEKRLTSENLQKWLKGLQERDMDVYLPRFKMTAEFSLADTLKAMGMPLAFSDEADFSRMTTQEPLSISAVVHKAFINVDEEGTEAAAASAISAAADPGVPEQPVTFRADHPFVLLIRDVTTDSILFMGRLVNPKDQGSEP